MYQYNININFGCILKKLRKSRNMSQEDFASLCNISRAYYGRVERGEHSATIELCCRIATSLDLPLSTLFENLQ